MFRQLTALLILQCNKRQPVVVLPLYAKRMEPKSEMHDLMVEFAVLRRADDIACVSNTLVGSSPSPLAAIIFVPSQGWAVIQILEETLVLQKKYFPLQMCSFTLSPCAALPSITLPVLILFALMCISSKCTAFSL